MRNNSCKNDLLLPFFSSYQDHWAGINKRFLQSLTSELKAKFTFTMQPRDQFSDSNSTSGMYDPSTFSFGFVFIWTTAFIVSFLTDLPFFVFCLSVCFFKGWRLLQTFLYLLWDLQCLIANIFQSFSCYRTEWLLEESKYL